MQSNTLLWRQVWAISALVAAVVVSLTIYGFYQGPILQNLGFSGLAGHLLIIQGLLGSLVEPLVGAYSDNLLHRCGSRLPQITLGVVLAGLIFVLLAFLIPASLAISLRWLIVFFMLLWVAAMMIFRSPVLALLCQLAPTHKLPMANSLLVMVLGLVAAIAPLLEQLLQQLPPSVSFLLASLLLVLSGIILRQNFPYQSHHRLYLSKSQEKSNFKIFLGLFLAGLGVGLGINLVLVLIPYRLILFLQGWSRANITSAILLIAALVSFPISEGLVKERISEKRALLIGLGAIAVLMGLTWLNYSYLGSLCLLIMFGGILGLILTEQIPLALAAVFPTEAGLATGLYLGGIGMATAIIAYYYPSPMAVTFLQEIFLVAIAMALAYLSLVKLLKSRP